MRTILRTAGVAFFLMHVHLVVVTKYRREVFTKEILDDLRGIFANVCGGAPIEIIRQYIEQQQTPH